jgi:hypothetical protein
MRDVLSDNSGNNWELPQKPDPEISRKSTAAGSVQESAVGCYSGGFFGGGQLCLQQSLICQKGLKFFYLPDLTFLS